MVRPDESHDPRGDKLNRSAFKTRGAASETPSIPKTDYGPRIGRRASIPVRFAKPALIRANLLRDGASNTSKQMPESTLAFRG